MDREQRHARYCALRALIPWDANDHCPSRTERGSEKHFNSYVIKWLVDNLHCSVATAKKWNMKQSTYPIPESKLKLMERFLVKDALKGD